MNKLRVFFGLSLVSACGGSSGGHSSEAVVFEGQLTQGAEVDHAASRVKHGASEPIENVKVCALGRCSTTDGEGQFGFAGPDDFQSGDVLFSIEGHGIVAEKLVSVPEAKNIFIHFESSASTEVHLHHLLADGVRFDPAQIDEAEHGHE